MVNHGPSRACGTCKRRRKKCDQERPACVRCTKAGFKCLGYKDETEIVFRHHTIGDDTTTSKPVHAMGLDGFAEKMHCDALKDDLINVFLRDFTVESTDRSISRGFLDGVRSMVKASGGQSTLAAAMRMIALASSAEMNDEKRARRDSRHIYVELLGSMREELAPRKHISKQALVMIVLLGIYELIMCSEEHSCYQNFHAQGISAVLGGQDSPVNLRAATELFQMGDPVLLQRPIQSSNIPGVLCAPASNTSVVCLDAILIKVHAVWSRSLDLFADPAASADKVRALQQDAYELDERFTIWSHTQPMEWLPSRVGSLSALQAARSAFPARPGAISNYFDLYVAAVWNTYRKTHLMIIDIIVACLQHFNSELTHYSELDMYMGRAESLAEGISASVPFHLAAELMEYKENLHKTRIGRPLGGLLLLHPLNVLLRSTSVSPEYRSYASQCLEWIGKNMKIGQASVLANPDNKFPFQSIAEGHILIWAGMLISPA